MIFETLGHHHPISHRLATQPSSSPYQTLPWASSTHLTSRRLTYLLKKGAAHCWASSQQLREGLANPRAQEGLWDSIGWRRGGMKERIELGDCPRWALGLSLDGSLGSPRRESWVVPGGTLLVLQLFSIRMGRPGLPSCATISMPGARVFLF